MVRSGYDSGATGSFSCLTGVDDSSSWSSCSSSSACCSGLHVRYGLTHPHTVQTRLASPIAARTNICARPPNLQVRMRCSGADAATEDSDGQASGADAAKAGGSKPAAAKPAAAKPAAPTPPEPAAAKPAAATSGSEASSSQAADASKSVRAGVHRTGCGAGLMGRHGRCEGSAADGGTRCARGGIRTGD